MKDKVKNSMILKKKLNMKIIQSGLSSGLRGHKDGLTYLISLIRVKSGEILELEGK